MGVFILSERVGLREVEYCKNIGEVIHMTELTTTILIFIASMMLVEAFFIALYMYRIYINMKGFAKKLDYIAMRVIDLKYR